MEQRSDLSRLVLRVRRVAIIALAVMAYAYYRIAAAQEFLATTGLLAFVAVAQFVPALIAALYWRGASRRGVAVGLLGGFALWFYTLLLPTFARAQPWIQDGPLGWGWLRPHGLFGLFGWDPVVHGTFWSLLVNVGCLVFISLRFHPSLAERLRAAAFIDASPANLPGVGDWRGRVAAADLRTIAERIVGERAATRAFDDYGQRRGRPLLASEAADRALIQYTERLLASAVGAANARRMLIGTLSGSGLDLAEAMALMDEASQELRFNRELLSTTLENVSQGISVVDAQMRLVAWNRRYLELFDYPEGMVQVGVPVASLIRWNADLGECGPGEGDEHVAKRIDYMRAGSVTSALRQQPGLDAEASKLAERIDASFHAAEGLLDALLDTSRLDVGSYHPEVVGFAMADMFESLRAQFAVIATQRGLRLRIVATGLAVRSDPQLLRRIVQNLISNALRYTSAGGVLVGARRDGDGVRIEVWDTGPGIPGEQLSRIFDEFQRLDQPSPWGEKGLGLGLSICDRLAGILGHRLDLHSVVGRGSCFVIRVPRSAAIPVRRRKVQRSGAGEQLPLTVLCLDNDVAILDGMRALLGRWGVDCRVALDMAQAKIEIQRGGVDVILADYHLTDALDGLQVVEYLRTLVETLPPVVVITADGSSALKQRARVLGYPLLHKPLRPAALRALLTALVRR